jgi:leader peptidase (prepilin peptidase)/N-methyltransferase
VNIFLAVVLALAGLAFGSFLNVCISRIPNDLSIVSPASRCPHCGTPIRWYHNVPVTSYFALQGRCADCHQRISLRYPVVELLTAVLFLACFFAFGFTLVLLKFAVFCFLLVGLIFMDAETGLLPHEFTYPGIAAGLVFAWFVPSDSSATEFLMHLAGIHANLSESALGLVDALLAAGLGALFFYVIWAAYYLIRKRHGVGFGDIALIAMCGAFLGLKLTLFVLFSAPLIASAFAIGLLIRNAVSRSAASDADAQPGSARGDAASHLTTGELLQTGTLPFGVFLGGCSLVAIFWGEAAWTHYLQWAIGR